MPKLLNKYADHGREFRDETTKLKANWGITPATIKDRAFDLLLMA